MVERFRLRGQRGRHHAELVAARVGEDLPGRVALTDVDLGRAEREQAGDLFVARDEPSGGQRSKWIRFFDDFGSDVAKNRIVGAAELPAMTTPVSSRSVTR